MIYVVYRLIDGFIVGLYIKKTGIKCLFFICEQIIFVITLPKIFFRNSLNFDGRRRKNFTRFLVYDV